VLAADRARERQPLCDLVVRGVGAGEAALECRLDGRLHRLGRADGVLYDVFANSILAPSSDTNHPWSWLGQSYHCVTNNLTITNLPNISAFLILGNNLDTDGDGLTDAYELLVSKTSPNSADSNSDGIPDGWLVLHRLPTQGSGIAGQDPDFDALTNLSEYLYGTDPHVSQGFSIWLANPAGFSGIP